MVPPRRHEEHDLPLLEDGRDGGDVWQVAAARQLGVVGDQYISLLDSMAWNSGMGKRITKKRERARNVVFRGWGNTA